MSPLGLGTRKLGLGTSSVRLPVGWGCKSCSHASVIALSYSRSPLSSQCVCKGSMWASLIYLAITSSESQVTSNNEKNRENEWIDLTACSPAYRSASPRQMPDLGWGHVSTAHHTAVYLVHIKLQHPLTHTVATGGQRRRGLYLQSCHTAPPPSLYHFIALSSHYSNWQIEGARLITAVPHSATCPLRNAPLLSSHTVCTHFITAFKLCCRPGQHFTWTCVEL